MRDAARWSVMDGETRALIERERDRYAAESAGRTAPGGWWCREAERVRQSADRADTYERWRDADMRCRLGREQDRQAGADGQEQAAVRQRQSE